MNYGAIDKIKRLTIIAMFSDDDLMNTLVLKGGNAMDVIYNASYRASWDLDFSMEKDFDKDKLQNIENKIIKVLKETFSLEGLTAFDIKLVEKPSLINPMVADFWGGYQIEFKLIENKKYHKLQNNIELLRRNSMVLGKDNRRKFTIDISKYEYIKHRNENELDGYIIYVYSPEMIVLEKLRAICQQMEEYSKIIKSNTRSARARDFYDIFTIVNHFKIEMGNNMELLKVIFKTKKVPLKLLGRIKNYREFHRPDFIAVENTVKSKLTLNSYDYYFDYVVSLCEKLKSLWDV